MEPVRVQNVKWEEILTSCQSFVQEKLISPAGLALLILLKSRYHEHRHEHTCRCVKK